MANLIVEGTADDVFHTMGDRTVQGLIKSFESVILEASPFGAKANLKYSVTESAALSGATSNIGTTIIPDGAFVLGVVVRVTTLITSAAAVSFSIGDGSDADKWGAGIAFPAGTTTTHADFTAGPSLYTSATNVVLTPNTGTFTGGKVRAAVFYIDFTALAA